MFRSEWEWIAVEGDAELFGQADTPNIFAASICHGCLAWCTPPRWAARRHDSGLISIDGGAAGSHKLRYFLRERL